MPRIIRVDATGPYKIEPKDFPTDGKSIFICACGLSNKMPICDGTHKSCRVTEMPGKLYHYDMATKKIVKEEIDNAPPPAPPTPPSPSIPAP